SEVIVTCCVSVGVLSKHAVKQSGKSMANNGVRITNLDSDEIFITIIHGAFFTAIKTILSSN
ncbi:hypothetical protein, partial [Pseudoalteromonas sp. SR45-5]|uniref:hypothetical protein n=1 Tax=Pseudoalteromonas sp. SR45-5 TaxID=2760928 RepID=UPI001C7291A7